MTEFEIASAIENYVTSHRGVTDFPLSHKQIRDEVDTLRLRMFEEYEIANKGHINLNAFSQSMLIDTKRDNNELYVEIPELHYLLSGKIACIFIGSSTSKTPFKLVSMDRSLYSDHDMYSGGAPTAIYNSGKITFKNTAPKKIYIDAVFKKPSELRKFGYDWKKTQYPSPYSIIDKIIGKSAESYLRLSKETLPQPNTQSDINTQGNAQLKQQ
jgi:hypothetical protein